MWERLESARVQTIRWWVLVGVGQLIWLERLLIISSRHHYQPSFELICRHHHQTTFHRRRDSWIACRLQKHCDCLFSVEGSLDFACKVCTLSRPWYQIKNKSELFPDTSHDPSSKRPRKWQRKCNKKPVTKLLCSDSGTITNHKFFVCSGGERIFLSTVPLEICAQVRD